MDKLIEHIRDIYAPRDLGELDYLLLSGGRREYGFVNVFFYANRSPLIIGKISRGEDAIIQKEIDNLIAVTALLKSSPLKGTIENIVDTVHINEHYVLLKDFKKGVSAGKYLETKSRNEVRKLLENSVNWLIQFLNDTKNYHINLPDNKSKKAKEIFTENDIPQWYKSFVGNDKYFLAPSHGDFIISNILVKDGIISAVLDFENFTFEGFPIADLIGILVSVGTTLYGYTEKMIYRTFFEKNWFSKEIKVQIRKFCENLDLDIEEFVFLMSIYSDRALSISNKWKLQREYNFHKYLKESFLFNGENILKILEGD